MDIEIGKLSGSVATEATVVPDAFMFSSHMSLQTVSGEAFVATLGTFELEVLVSCLDMSLQMGQLGTGIVARRTFVDNSFVDRLDVSFEVECCGSFELAAFLRTNQAKAFMGYFDVLFELGFLLAGIITLIAIVAQSFMFSLNVDIEFKLSLGRKVTVRTFEGNVVVDSLDVTFQTALALQFQPAGRTVEPETFMAGSDVLLQGGLGLAGVGAVRHQTPVGLKLMSVSDVLPQDPGVCRLELTVSHRALESLPFKLVVGHYVLVESALGGTFIVALSAVHGDLKMFEVFMFLQDAGPRGGKTADVAAMQDVLMDGGEMSPERALVGELFAALRTLPSHQVVDNSQVPQQVGSPSGHIVTLLTSNIVILLRRLVTQLQLLRVEDFLPVIRPTELFIRVEILETILWTGVNITELIHNISKCLLDININFHLQ